ncbi:hypothetical protein AAFF_G00162890 [Aldrovandia affinis]|uniref:Protein kinase domain-containing protein n=1 Tax=Aldrovandia affinis TaxID=143900 RepID=A0AAD7SZ61_9TELE|nr:hypothetical protein AAFF_G00162890 [Aldrovandia affinis]
MGEEGHPDRLALLSQKLQSIKTRYFTEDNTDNINQVISSNSPETCWAYLLNLEKKGDPHTDSNLLTRLIDCYTRVFSSLPLAKHGQNESYARTLVRFAQLKAIRDPDEARDHFAMARSGSEAFSFVHTAHAQFELSQGNAKKSASILQRAFEVNAIPSELLETALQNLKSGRTTLLSTDDKENMMVPVMSSSQDPMKSSTESHKVNRTSDGTGDLQLGSALCPGTDQNCATQEDPAAVSRSGPQRRRIWNMPGRVPLLPFSIPEADWSGDYGMQMKKSDTSCSSTNMTRQTSGSRANARFTFSSSKKGSGDGDSYNLLNLKPSVISPDPRPWEESGAVDSTTTLLHRLDVKASTRTEVNTTESLSQIISSNSPETCWAYLLNLEKKGDPHTDSSLLTRLIDCYTWVFSSLPLGKTGQSESYARMLVRFAQLKAIQDADEAQDNFIIARSSCKSFAFVHIAHAQFMLSQGNPKKSASILQRAFEVNAKPTELLEMALQNLKSGRTTLLSTDDKENMMGEPPPHALPAGQSERVEGHQPKVPWNPDPHKPARVPSSDWKIPARIRRYVSPEEKRFSANQMPTPHAADPTPAPCVPPPARGNPVLTCQTPNQKPFNANSFVTPVVKRNPPVVASVPRPHGFGMSQQPCTPQNQVCPAQQTPQGSVAALSNDSITIKGRQFFILKMIGQGGSSKVYQVLDHRRQLFAVKYVNLEEADTQTVESYKNEIEHLNHLQQYSDQIIKLYDYEITNSHIYMLMECGNLDLNTWLRNRKTVNPLERKFYWKNMLEAVHTIHKHGIVHSDLKPANFVIVNASLKLIDFGISNRIHPDVTSIVKDSQVGTLNYMPPEAIKDPSSWLKAKDLISPKGDVWSLGCILYCMTYGKTPFQKITNQFTKMHAIVDPSHDIDFPDITERDLLDVLKSCLIRNPKLRISITELLAHPYLQLQPQSVPEPAPSDNGDLKRILNELAALQSPNSIVRAASNLAKMCNSGQRLDVSECVRSSSQY